MRFQNDLASSLPDCMLRTRYAIIGAYFGFCLWVGVTFKKKGEQQGMDSYVVAGRNLPWWLIGTSMVATTFSAETPLLVANLVYKYGIVRNWEWWCFLPGATS